MKDKLFFTQTIKDSDIFFDFGCADGTMIYYLNELYPDAKFFGFDADEDMIDDAIGMEMTNAVFSNDFEFLMTQCIEAMGEGHKSTLILSSVIHEINSYLKDADRVKFWEFVLKSGFDYVSIRDMCMSKSDYEKLMQITNRADIKKLWEYGDSQQLDDFIKMWGGVYSGGGFVHFLLKYHYKENWERELRENYLTIMEDIMQIIRPSQYRIKFLRHYVLPYIKEKVWNEFNIDLKMNTHIQLVLELRDD